MIMYVLTIYPKHNGGLVKYFTSYHAADAYRKAIGKPRLKIRKQEG